MAYVIIVFVVLLLVAPIIALRPSERSREQSRLRRAAMSEGLQTNLTTIADPDPDPEKYLSGTGKPLPREIKLIAYRLGRRRPNNWRKRPTISWVIVRRAGAEASDLPATWQWEASLPDSASDELRSFLTNRIGGLPDDVVRVEEEDYTISVYWREKGGTEALEAIVSFLKDCRETPLHKTLPDDDDAAGSDPS